jgi:hypothetical protein
MGSAEEDSEDVGVPRTQANSPASVLMVNTPLSPPQRPLRASLRASVSILMGWCSRNLRGGSRSSSLTCLRTWHRPSRPADQHRVRCLSENNARWRSGGEESCGWRGRLSRSSGGGRRMKCVEQCRLLKAEWDGYSDGLCRACAPHAAGSSHDLSTPKQSGAPPLENLCDSSSSPSRAS